MSALAAVLSSAAPARAQIDVPDGFVDEPVVTGLTRPVGLAFIPGDPRVFVIEQTSARVRLVVNGALAAVDPVLTVDSVRTAHGEQGLLGIAVDPFWPARPYLYVMYDFLGSQTLRVRRYRVGGDLAFTGSGALTIDPTERREILTTLPDVAGNHNGGTLRFGPDHMLYVSIGDDEVPCNAQRVDQFHGKILRLNVAGVPALPGGPPDLSVLTPPDNPFVGHPDPRAGLVWQMGLRNPFRIHLDTDGTAMIADVGQDAFEEIDWAPAAGMNFGWPMREAFTTRPVTCPGADPATFVPPVYAFDHADPPLPGASASIVGGGVYRAPAAGGGFPPAYAGCYFFTDYYRAYVRVLQRVGAAWSPLAPAPGQPNATDWGTSSGFIADMMSGPDGALWYVQQFSGSFSVPGQLRRVRYAGTLDAGAPAPTAITLGASAPSAAGVAFTVGLPRAMAVSLDVFDLEGRRIVRLAAARPLPAGRHEVRWDGRDARGERLPSGIVFARLVADGVVRTCRLSLLR